MEQEKSYYQQILTAFRKAYRDYNSKFEVFKDDTITTKISKRLGRVVLLTLLIILSPVAFAGIFFAFIAAT